MPKGYPNNPAPQPDRRRAFDPGDLKAINRMEDTRIELEGEQCLNCRGIIAVDQTPAYVFKSKDICHCLQEY